MGVPAILACCFFLPLLLIRVHSVPNVTSGRRGVASTPPRGWNSYDSFAWIVNEDQFLENADIVSKRLLKHGYEYVVVDYLWYRRLEEGANRDSYGHDVLDHWGRVIPDPGRWPSSRDGSGFKRIAQKVHNLGLKFGIHVMRGMSTQAFNNDTPILDVKTGDVYTESGRQWKAGDIGIKERTCAWMSHGFMSVNTDLGAGRAFLRSLYTQYAEWGVDFVKLDCIFGDDLDVKEILTVAELLEELDRPMVYSLSPGTHVTPDMAKVVSSHVNMYRITADDWDTWTDVAAHFDISRDVASSNLIGANGLRGKSWPDLDMLPLGWLTNSYGNVGPYRRCNLTFNEQKTQMTLWSMARSPLIFGGDLRNTDENTFTLITNPTLLEINSYSSNNKEFPYVTVRKEIGSDHVATQSSRNLLSLSNSNQISVVSCNDPNARGWFVQRLDSVQDKICWLDTAEGAERTPFCLHHRKLLGPLWRGMDFQNKIKFHLLARDNTNHCLDASSPRKLSASETKGTYSLCEWKLNQMWELDDDGTLRSNYSGLCASLMKNKDEVGVSGARSWVATGKKGTVYLAFFNLYSYDAVVSARLPDLAKALPSGSLGRGACRCKEVWSGKDFGQIDLMLSTMVASHGCALFVLVCK